MGSVQHVSDASMHAVPQQVVPVGQQLWPPNSSVQQIEPDGQHLPMQQTSPLLQQKAAAVGLPGQTTLSDAGEQPGAVEESHVSQPAMQLRQRPPSQVWHGPQSSKHVPLSSSQLWQAPHRSGSGSQMPDSSSHVSHALHFGAQTSFVQVKHGSAGSQRLQSTSGACGGST
jgi:hypothetical protein